MRNKILLIYHFQNHSHNVERLAKEMQKAGIGIDLFCISNCKGSFRTADLPFGMSVLSWLGNSRLFLLKKLSRLLLPYFLIKLISKYSYIDYNSFYPIFYKPIQYCVSHHIRYDITLLCSDFMRASKEKISNMEYGIENAHVIKVMSPSLAKELDNVYNSKYSSKIRVVDFGNIEFEFIEKIKNHEIVEPHLFENEGKKIIITCGYNGIVQQNHILMIDALSCLNDDQKRSIHVVIPLTYGCKQDYIDKLGAKIKSSGVSYTILTNYLNQAEIAALRLSTDIMLNMQETDAFAGSIQGHLFAGNILISGDWLEYEELETAKVFYVKTSRGNLKEIVSYTLEHYDEYKQLCENNVEKMKVMKSWAAVSKLWESAYIS